MPLNQSSTASFDRAKFFVFKFLTHQIHPYAFAMKAFLQPALDECLRLMSEHPADTFHVLLSLARSFTSFTPDAEFIYDEIQQFAIQLKATLDQCSVHLDPQTLEQTSETLASIRASLLARIRQHSNDDSPFIEMYKNLSAVLTSLEKSHTMHTTEIETQLVDRKKEIDSGNQKPPLGPTSPAPVKKRIDLVQSIDDSIELLTKALIDPDAKASVSSSPSPITTSSRSSFSSQLISSSSNGSSREGFIHALSSAREPMIDLTNTASYQQASHVPTESTTNDTSLPASVDPSLRSYVCSSLYEILTKDYPWLPVKLDDDSENTIPNSQLRRTPIRFDASQSTISAVPKIEETSDDYNLGAESSRPTIAWSEWYPTDDRPTTTIGRYADDQITSIHTRHITDIYLKQFRKDSNRSILHGELSMTYGQPQNGPQTSCMPIGVALTHDECTLLSCDVHQTAELVRLFDVRTGQCKRTIVGNQQMRSNRPSAVLGYVNDTIIIVEKDAIHITGSDGHWIQTISHPSIRQLYGIALFRDQYLVTLDSKVMSSGSPEACRLLFFDPRNGQLILEKPIVINRQSKMFLEQQEMINYIQGGILSETTSKPRFLAVHNEHIYIADLGRNLIYGTSLDNPAELTYMTVFGGHGQANGQMIEPAGLFIDTGGNIISADSKNDRIQLFSSNGEYRTTLELNASIKRPSGICTNRAGTQLFVSCYLAGCVRAFHLDY